MTGDQQIKREPLVSIIIPVYNVRKYICEALDSVINQTYKNLEIIVIDDGSTDGSGRVCDAYAKKDPRIRVIHQENKGLSAARNAGLDVMTGEYVGFLDSDDAFETEMVECMMRGIEENGVEMAVCGYTVHNTTRRMTEKKACHKRHFERMEVLSGMQMLNRMVSYEISFDCWSKIFCRTLFNNVRFPEGHVYEDMCVIYILLERCDCILCMDKPLVKHRNRLYSITTTMSYQNIGDLIHAMRRMENYVIRHTPDLFDYGSRETLLDNQLRHLSVTYSDLLYRKPQRSSVVLKMLRQEVLKRGRELGGGIKWRTRITFILFKYFPLMIPAVRAIYYITKKMPHMAIHCSILSREDG